MGLKLTILFLLVDLVFIDAVLTNVFISSPVLDAKEGVLWRPSEIFVEGQDFKYEVTIPDFKYGTMTADLIYNIMDTEETEVKVHGLIPSKEDMVNIEEVKTESGDTFILTKPRFRGLVGGEEDFDMNLYTLKATGSKNPALAWDSYVYHPSLYSFYDNRIATGNKWAYVGLDGYAYGIEVVGKEEVSGRDAYILEVKTGTREIDRIWVDPKIPVILKYKKMKDTGELIFSSLLVNT